MEWCFLPLTLYSKTNYSHLLNSMVSPSPFPTHPHNSPTHPHNSPLPNFHVLRWDLLLKYLCVCVCVLPKLTKDIDLNCMLDLASQILNTYSSSGRSCDRFHLIKCVSSKVVFTLSLSVKQWIKHSLCICIRWLCFNYKACCLSVSTSNMQTQKCTHCHIFS